MRKVGTLCPCGVQVDAAARRKKVRLNWCNGNKCGNLTYKADVCVTTLGMSSLSLRFEENDSPNRYSFLFIANEITNITCRCEGQNCVLTVTGIGRIGVTYYPFVAVFVDQGASTENDIVQSFVIKGFCEQSGAVSVEQGSIVALGCQKV